MRLLALACLAWALWIGFLFPAPRAAERQVPVAPLLRAPDFSTPAASATRAPAVAATREPTPTTTSPVTGSVTMRPVASNPASLSGRASWYRYVPGGAAAGPLLREWLGPKWRGMHVQVCAASTCVTVKLSDWCLCTGSPRRVIDLDSRSFAQLAPLSRGIVAVTIFR